MFHVERWPWEPAARSLGGVMEGRVCPWSAAAARAYQNAARDGVFHVEQRGCSGGRTARGAGVDDVPRGTRAGGASGTNVHSVRCGVFHVERVSMAG